MLVAVPMPSGPSAVELYAPDGSTLRSHVLAVCAILWQQRWPDLPGTTCTQEQLVLGVHTMAEVLLQLAPRLVQVSAAQRRATSPAP